MRTLHTGPDEFLVAAKVAVDPDETAARVADIVDLAEQRIRNAVPAARWIYIEADIRRPGGLRHRCARCRRGPGGVVAHRAVGRAITGG